MPQTRRAAIRLGLTALGTAASTYLKAAPLTTIDIGPDRLIGDPTAIQGEPCIAAHPTNPDHLIVSACNFTDGQIYATAYASLDAGSTWLGTRLKPGANNWVTYGSDGTAYFSANPSFPPDLSSILIYRSFDDGRTWSAPSIVPGHGYDQPRIVAGAGKLYVATYLGAVAVARSGDSGTSFEVTEITPNNLGNQPLNPVILSDGSLVVPFADFPNFPDAQPASSRIWILRSTDEGKTFDHPHFIADVPRSWPGGGMEIAASHDRLYAVWDSGDFGGRVLATVPNLKREESGNHRELSVAYSLNNGKTWSTPRQINQPGLGPAFMGSIDVAPNGTIGLLWVQHERYETNPKTYRIWFSVSTDGGETFTQPKVVSSAISNPDPAQLTKIEFLARRPRGGDYIRVIAAADSSFHAVWSDARDGLFRVYHSHIRVSQAPV